MTSRAIHRTFRYRLYPTPEQEAALRQYAGVCRLVYNLGWEQRTTFWRQYRRAVGRHISFASQSADLKYLRKEYEWIAAVPFAALAYALRDLDGAFTNFLSGRAKYPTPRRLSQGHGFRLKGEMSAVTALSTRWATVRIPKLGDIRFRHTRHIAGAVRNVSFMSVSGRWYVCFATGRERAQETPLPGAVGIDRGITQTLTLSTGEHCSAPRLAALAKRHRRAQRALSRRRRGSKRYASQRARVASLSARAARIRMDWAHRTSTDIANRFGLVAIEALNIRAMTASAGGAVEAPGRNVRQKAALNRSILEQSWGRWATLLDYKLQERGGQLISVPAAYTSQTCASCGAVDARSRKSQAVFQCVHCGHADNADANAAKEILRRGTAWLGAEGAVGFPLNRQLEGASTTGATKTGQPGMPTTADRCSALSQGDR